MSEELSSDLQAINGRVIFAIDGLEKESERVKIFTECGGVLEFHHIQDCCEHVRLVDFDGDAKDLSGGSIIGVECVVNVEEIGGDGQTWTFYKIETSKGGLWMRWLGESNGYYSEEVNVIWRDRA